ncbi:MAG: hypothetical protein IKD40_03125 [Bacteroidaceae bacterium]|nr:hypothetical protein [Bacteroidaceae bacterium]
MKRINYKKSLNNLLVSFLKDISLRCGWLGLCAFLLTIILFHAFLPAIHDIVMDVSLYMHNKFNNSVATRITTLFFLISALCLIVKKFYRKRMPDMILALSFYVLLFYIYIRWCDSSITWEYIVEGYLTYFDVAGLLSAAILILYITECVRYASTVSAENVSGDNLLIDDAITDSKEDILGRLPFVKEFVKTVVDCDTGKSAYSIGVVAPWGEGKTSFLKLFVNEVKSMNCNLGIIHFSPWHHSSSRDVCSAFFTQLLKYVANENRVLFNLIREYSKHVIGEFGSIGFSLLGSEPQPDELFDNISKILLARNERIVVIIDDLDRLNGEEILEIFKIIRGSANFPNMIFIAAYDKEYVINAINSVRNIDNERFIEKFFQAEFYLPKFSSEKVSEYILAKVKEFMSDDDYIDFKDNYVESKGLIYREKPHEDYIKNIRDAKRWINSIRMEYKLLRNEVRICDLADVSMLKLYLPTVYNMLSCDYEKYFKNESGYYRLWTDSDKIDKLYSHNKKVIWKSEAVDKLKENDKVKLKNILSRLLPDYVSFPKDKQFNDSFYTSRYFYRILQYSDIYTDEFDKYVAMESNEMRNTLTKEYIDGRKIALLKHYRYYKPLDDSERLKLLRIIFYTCAVGERFFCSQDIIFNLITGFNATNEEKAQILRSLMYENGVSYYVCLLINEIKNNIYDWNLLMSNEEYESIQLDILRNAINENIPLNEIFSIFWLTSKRVFYKNGNNTDVKYVCSSKALGFLKDGVAKHPMKYLFYLIGQLHSHIDGPVTFVPHNLISQMWPDWNDFELFLNTLPDTEECSEYKDFYKKFKDNGYKAVGFEFNYGRLYR